MARIEAGAQQQRLRIAAEVLTRANDEGRAATAREVQTAARVSERTAKRLLELAAGIVLHEGATAALLGAPPPAPKPARKNAKPAAPRAKRPARAVAVTVMGPFPRTIALDNPCAWGERRDGTDPIRPPAAILRSNIAELGPAVGRIKNDLQIMRFWVYGPVVAEKAEPFPGLCAACSQRPAHNFPPRPMATFGPIGTSIDVANLYKTFTDILERITNAVTAHNDVQEKYYSQVGLKEFSDSCICAVQDMFPEHKREIGRRVRTGGEEYGNDYRGLNGRPLR